MKVFLTTRSFSIVAVFALLCGCGQRPAPQTVAATPSTKPATATVHVTIDNFSYSPAEITIPAGATVTWTNRDDVPHTVTSNAKAFGSKALDTDDTFTHAFTSPGTYDYFCAVHTHMTGRVIVK